MILELKLLLPKNNNLNSQNNMNKYSASLVAEKLGRWEKYVGKEVIPGTYLPKKISVPK
jgi:hypothetical protein